MVNTNLQIKAIALLWLGTANLNSEVITDGSVGLAQNINVIDKNYDIRSELGTTRGGNLFHSFNSFTVEENHSATFHGTDAIKNILGRVTGGDPSLINGTLKTRGTNADLFLMNPAGIIFGKGSKLELGGSFHASTADSIHLGEQGVFSASEPDQSVLVSDPPSAFGFVNQQPKPIQVSETALNVQLGEDISLVGGDVTISSSTLDAGEGGINLVAAKRVGSVPVQDLKNNSRALKAEGNVEVRDQSTLNTGWFNGGTIYIRSGRFVLDNSTLDVSTLALPLQDMEGAGGSIDLSAQEIEVRNSADMNLASRNSKEGGKLILESSTFSIDKAAINGSSSGSGKGAHMQIKTDELTMNNGANIQLQSYGNGQGGSLDVDAQFVEIKGSQSIITADASYPRVGVPDSGARGKGGAIEINSKTIRLAEGAQISAGTWGDGDGGNLNLNSTDLTLDHGFIGVSARRKTGSGGDLEIKAQGSLSIKNDSQIAAYTWEDGVAGSVKIEAANMVLDGQENGASINGETYGSKSGADLVISGTSLTLKNGSKVTASSKGSGDAGNLDVDFESIEIINGGQISSRSFASGKGGELKIAAQTLKIAQEGEISSEVLQTAVGGNIQIKVKELTMEDGRIFGDTGGSGTGSQISIEADKVLLKGSSQISSTAVGDGAGGKITLKASESIELVGSSSSQEKTLDGALSSKLDGTKAILIERQKEIQIDQEISALEDRQRTENQLQAASTQAEINQKYAEREEIIGRVKAIEKEANKQRYEFHGLMLGSASKGASGDIEIDAPRIKISSGAGITAASLKAGNGGQVQVNATSLMMENGAAISGTTFGKGLGGVLDINAGELSLQNASYVQSESFGLGDAGNINISGADKIILAANSRVSTLARKSDGGNIEIEAKTIVHLDHSVITAEVRGGQGNGGNITIDPEYVTLNSGQIIANAYEGNGGNIRIVAQTFLASLDSAVTASSKLGVDGIVEIDAPQIDLSSSLVDLALEFIDSNALVPRLCLPTDYEKRNSFQVTRQKWLPPSSSYLPWNLQ